MSSQTVFLNVLSQTHIEPRLREDILQVTATNSEADAACLRRVSLAKRLLESFGIRPEEEESDRLYLSNIRERISVIKCTLPEGATIPLDAILASPIATVAFFERLKQIELIKALWWTVGAAPGNPSDATPEKILQQLKVQVKNPTIGALSLRNQAFLHLPHLVCTLHLTYLDISNNFIQTLPPTIKLLTKLDTLYASGNPIKWVPDEIKDLANLRFLTIDFEYGVGDQVMVWLQDIENRTGLLSQIGIDIPQKDSSLSQVLFLRQTMLKIEDIAQFCKEPKSPAVLLVQPQALEECLKRALEKRYLFSSDSHQP